jgi:cyclophilin family peptidyl-prolyl cis-trans isomerase
MRIYKQLITAFVLSLCTVQTNATIVEFQTNQGNIRVNLFDETTPETVANFLDYVALGAYENSFIHRSVPGFIIQGGGYVFDSSSQQVSSVETNSPVANEPIYSNVRGTIAMAKVSGDPNSATSQWFFNLENNAPNLDIQNGGFTVFGQVIDNGLATIDAIAALPVYNFSGFPELPLDNYTQEDYSNNTSVTDENLVIIYDIVIVDSAVDTAANLNPVENTLINQQNNGSEASSSGGSLHLVTLLLFTIALARQKFKV